MAAFRQLLANFVSSQDSDIALLRSLLDFLIMTTNAILTQEGTTELAACNNHNWWDAVLARDGNRDGEGVFAVSTTGVYSGPSCPAEPPRREHVAFARRPEAAER